MSAHSAQPGSVHLAPSAYGVSGARVQPGYMWIARATGFFMAFRMCLTFVFFQSDPQLGTVVNISLLLALLGAALFCQLGKGMASLSWLLHLPVLRWILLFLLFAGCSLLWTQAKSSTVAAIYWVGMCAEVFLAVLLVGKEDALQSAIALMKGFVCGSCVVAIVAWLSPTLPDLRIGNDEFLHPNGLGWEFAIAALCAQYLVRHGGLWKWLSIALAITLLRTISKTSIVAYMAAEGFYLLRDRELTRKAKIYIGFAAALVLAAFSALLASYFAIYNSSGDQAETLTGRTWIWGVSLGIAVEKPLLGYGIYSYRAVIPPFGPFEPWHAHNEMIQQLFEYGIVGLCIAIAIYWSFFLAVRRSPASGLKTLAFSLFIFATLHGLTDTIIFNLSYPFWLLAALAIVFASSTPERTGKALS